ncbi:electron transport complex subunit RsxC [Pseudoalteromonas sp. A22]|uniref:electron transport complex subunit RsxC n=1 Tax=Pseudoalteromonas TaxID=53246 RepID=UPI001BA5BB3E|nr:MULTISPECIES: electron transport complex subunit RsxC [Pseudoalteromonas]QUI62636.1 electron transport complex subunit RsxC [Pseudoalteromonas sp. A22]USE68284.1 electron transport complex subunit RsxC [Pseudoalteromonas flavipulchra]
METLLEQIESGKLWQFPGGIHPPEQKTLSNQQPIARLPLPDKLILPLKQHIGANGSLLVNSGEHVLKGQALTAPGTNWSLPIHAPTSGTIEAIKPMPSAHPSALPELSIILRPDGEDKWTPLNPISDISTLDNKQLIDIIHQAGIAGMGGAGFPTYVKADSPKPIEFLVVNGIECEPYITADDRLMREHAKEIIAGVEVLQGILKPQKVLFGIEDNKPEAIAAITAAAQHNQDILVRSVPTKYPSGGEKQLVKLLTSKEVPSAGIPADIGVLVQNVGTLFAIWQAIFEGKPLIERVVTVTGNTITQPSNVWALLGTEIKHLLDSQGFTPVEAQRVVMGGPMMGFTLPSVRIPVVKTTNCILAPDNQELAIPGDEKACIRCSACADACPQSLLPQQLQWFAKGKEYQKLEEYNLFDCIECGACSYVCPSEIPLVQYYRVAKADIREQKLEQVKAERAKERFEARKERLEREQEERQNKHKRRSAGAAPKTADKEKVQEALSRVKDKQSDKSAVQAAIARAKAKRGENGELEPDNSAIAEERAKRKAQARKYKEEKTDQPESTDKKDAVAAAIARAKAKKAAAQASPESEPAATDDKKAAVAAAIARAKAKKAAAEDTAEPEANAAPSDKKAAVAAAIARAKAKKAAKEAEEAGESISEQAEASHSAQTDNADEDPRKAAVAAAIARAKAKKAAKEAEEAGASVSEQAEAAPTESAEKDPRKAAVAAAIARAKAKKAAKEAEEAGESTSEQAEAAPTESAEEDPRKAAVAAAIARAKAKKAAKEAEEAGASVSEQAEAAPTASADEDPRKAAVAAAIARAKAKKAAKEAEEAGASVSEQAEAAPTASAEEDPRKAAVAAAIARAKAKKAAKEAQEAGESVSEQGEETNEPTAGSETDSSGTEQGAEGTSEQQQALSPEARKKAAVKAAIARAKAKKQAKEQEGNEPS